MSKSVEVAEVFPYADKGLACLVIQSNNGTRSSEINLCDDFSESDPETVFTQKGWIYSMLQKTDEIYIAMSGKELRWGAHADPHNLLKVDADVTKLCDSATGVWIIGLDGYVAHFDGKHLVETPLTEAGTVYFVSEAPDGTVFACGDSGGLFRLDAQVWTRLELPTTQAIYRILASSASRVLLAGEDGLCGVFEDGELKSFTAPEGRNYRAIAEFRGQIFFGAGRDGLDMVVGTLAESFKDNIFSFHLNSNDQYLFASGLNEVARYDGEAWLATEFS
jgi:hypothetical protein